MTLEAPLGLAAPVIGIRCHYCSHFRSHFEMVRFGVDRAIKMCWLCYQKHLAALAALQSGNLVFGCAECGAGKNEGNVTMMVHFKDGVYQILCPRCSDVYVQQRADLYADTPFGWARKLK